MSKAEQMMKKRVEECLKEGHVGHEHDLGVIPFEEALQMLNKKGAKITLKPHKSH